MKKCEKKQSAEEILKDNMSDYYWELIETQITQPGSVQTFKSWILGAMQEYSHQSRGEELQRFADTMYAKCIKYPDASDINEYLNLKP